VTTGGHYELYPENDDVKATVADFEAKASSSRADHDRAGAWARR